jgi:hypothetical protein
MPNSILASGAFMQSTPPHADEALPRESEAVSPRDAARQLPQKEETVRGWCRTFGIGLRIGGRWQIPAEAVALIRSGLPLSKVAARVRGK